MVTWPPTGPDELYVNPGETYFMKVVRVPVDPPTAEGQNFPFFNIFRSTTDYVPDPVRGLGLDNGTLVMDPGFYDLRGYVVGGDFGPPDPCHHPVFDVTGELTPGESDGVVDGYDFVEFKNCASGPGDANGSFATLSQECQCLDRNGDRSIDQSDFGVFQLCFSGTTPADPTCDRVP